MQKNLITKHMGGHIALVPITKLVFDFCHQLLEINYWDVAFYGSGKQAPQEFLRIKGLYRPIFFLNHKRGFFTPLVSSETRAAREALTSATDARTVFR